MRWYLAERWGRQEATMWWMWIVGLAVVIVGAYLVERRRGTRSEASAEDHHLNRPDIRGGGGF